MNSTAQKSLPSMLRHIRDEINVVRNQLRAKDVDESGRMQWKSLHVFHDQVIASLKQANIPAKNVSGFSDLLDELRPRWTTPKQIKTASVTDQLYRCFYAVTSAVVTEAFQCVSGSDLAAERIEYLAFCSDLFRKGSREAKETLSEICAITMAEGIKSAATKPWRNMQKHESEKDKHEPEGVKTGLETATNLDAASFNIVLDTVAERPLPRQNHLFKEIDRKRSELLEKCQEFVSSREGVKGQELVDAAREIVTMIETHSFVLRPREAACEDQMESTFKVAARRKGQPVVVICATLAQKVGDGEVLETMPPFIVVSLEECSPIQKEAFFTRIGSRFRGQRVASSNRSAEASSKGGFARAKSLTAQQKAEIGKKGGEASGKARSAGSKNNSRN